MGDFSRRHGYAPSRGGVQYESLDRALRNALWNATYLHVFVHPGDRRPEFYLSVMRHLGRYVFNVPIDEIPQDEFGCQEMLKKEVLEGEWNRVLDIVEATLKAFKVESRAGRYALDCNEAFERELSAYRIIEGLVTPIHEEVAIAAVEDALRDSIPSAKQHFQRALALMSDRSIPDWPNSIKESISAVEAIFREISGKDDASLGAAVSAVTKSGPPLHPRLAVAIDKLWAYTSTASAVRHARKANEAEPGPSEALFVLVVCSAISSYLMSRFLKLDRAPKRVKRDA